MKALLLAMLFVDPSAFTESEHAAADAETVQVEKMWARAKCGFLPVPD